MKNILLLLLLCSFYGTSQKLVLKKGVVIDTVPIIDKFSESFSLYLPTNFELSKKWPIVFVFGIEGRRKEALSMFKSSAEKEGYILASSNNVYDSLSISQNVYITKRMINSVYATLPIQKNRSYTAGFSNGGWFASLLPTFIKEIKGVISCGSPIANIEVLAPKKRFHFIGIVGNEDYNYIEMLNSQKLLNKINLPNYLILFKGGHLWPPKENLSKAFQILTLSSMTNKDIPKDTTFIESTYKDNFDNAKAMVFNTPLFAYNIMQEMVTVYNPLKNIDSLKESANQLRKSKEYRSNNRNRKSAFFKESLLKEDYEYYIEEDILTYNYNNLGWWKYQIDELEKYTKATNVYKKNMGKRLKLYLNTLIADKINTINLNPVVDEEALNFLWMLSTVTNPKKYNPYLKIISYNAKVGDYDTSLFYVEELLKSGYTDKDELYSLKNTALLRISPGFNKIVSKYFKDARYDVIED